MSFTLFVLRHCFFVCFFGHDLNSFTVKEGGGKGVLELNMTGDSVPIKYGRGLRRRNDAGGLESNKSDEAKVIYRLINLRI